MINQYDDYEKRSKEVKKKKKCILFKKQTTTTNIKNANKTKKKRISARQ